MATVSMFLPSLSGTTGLVLWLRKSSDYSVVNTGGDALTESSTSGWFAATVAETWTEQLSATVIDGDGLVPAAGWLGVGSLIVSDVRAELDAVVLAQLTAIQDQTDLIGSAAGATTLLAASVLETGTITEFPETLTIGDSYTTMNGRSIQIPIVDTDGNQISSTGSLDFADATATFEIKRAGETDSTRIITGTAVFSDPVGTGTSGAPYATIELTSSETAKGLIKYKYSGVLTFTWPYVGTGTDAEVMSFETGVITFDN